MLICRTRCAVSNAGGLGIITALTQPSADDLKKKY